MTYKTVSTITAALFALLSLTLLAMPPIIYWLFGIEGTSASDILARRAAMLFISLALIMFWTRNHPASETRSAIAKAVSIAMISLALLGTFEWLRGAADAGIAIAIVTELIIAAALLKAR